MKPLYNICVLVVMLITMASSCEEKAEQTLTKDMVEFDQAFVPVLYYVMKGDMDMARKSVFYLNHNWQRFYQKYKQIQAENDDWQESLRMTDAWLADAFYAIDASAPRDAFMFLDHVRYQFIDFRFQQDMAYDLDKLWEFEATLDVVGEVAVDQMLCLLEYCEFEELVDDMNQAFADLESTKFQDLLSEWNETQWLVHKAQIKNLKSTLTIFNQAVEEADQEELAITATYLQRAYLDYLYSFGDFLSSKTYFAAL